MIVILLIIILLLLYVLSRQPRESYNTRHDAVFSFFKSGEFVGQAKVPWGASFMDFVPASDRIMALLPPGLLKVVFVAKPRRAPIFSRTTLFEGPGIKHWNSPIPAGGILELNWDWWS